MTRVFGITILVFAGSVALLGAQGRPGVAKKEGAAGEKKADAKADPEKKEPVAPPMGSGEKPEEIIKRLNENFEKSEERLGAKDPREETQKVQDQIVKDIDELLKQQGKGGGGGGGGGGASSQSKGGKGSQSAGNKGGSSGNSAGNKGGNSKDGGKGQSGQEKKGDGQQNAKNQENKGGKDGKKNGDDKVAKNDDKKGQDGKGDGKDGKGKDGKGGNNAGGGTNKDEPKKTTIADLHREVWGHLPQKQRQEMEIYGKQRFLPKYEDLLRQYYRTISESDRRKDE